MKINWNFSETMLAKCKRIDDLRKEGKTWDQVTAEIGQTRAYLLAVYKEYKRLKGGVAS